MNLSTILGFLIGAALIVGAVIIGTDNPLVFIHLPGMLIVFGGLAAASLVSFPGRELARIAKVLSLVLRNEKLDLNGTVHQIQALSGVVAREGIDALDDRVQALPPSFLRDGLEMVVDQLHPDELLTVLERRIEMTFDREMNEARLLHTMAKMSPAFGMLGTTLGLVTMMTHLDFDGFAKLGAGLATALTTTFYGLVLSHLVFTPLANRLESRADERVLEMRLISEGMLLLARRVPPSIVVHRLQAYLPPRMWEDTHKRKGKGRAKNAVNQ